MTHSVIDHARHSAYTDPGRYAGRLAVVPADPAGLSAVVRNVIVHYRAGGEDLPDTSAADIQARWLSTILNLDESRHPEPLASPRPVTERVQGCCRDHTLLSVGILREHGIPARSRVGFADYFDPRWHHDHVIPEYWDGDRWHRFEPELATGQNSLEDPLDVLRGNGFHAAAEVWRGVRAGELDAETYGVDIDEPETRGQWFIRNYVVSEVAHRFGDELLLWDSWGTMGGPDEANQDLDLIDEVARLLIAADDGDLDAERRLLDLYRNDDRLRPGETIQRFDLPTGALVQVSLTRDEPGR